MNWKPHKHGPRHHKTHSITFLLRVKPVSGELVITVLGLLAAIAPSADARISHAACSGNHCIQINHQHNLCFHPNPDMNSTSACAFPAVEAVLSKHISLSGSRDVPTTAYYNKNSLHFLGGPGWSVNALPQERDAGLIVVCSTGLVGGTTFLSLCHVSWVDEDFGLPVSNQNRCERIHGHDQRVLREKCCGPPRTICPPSHDPVWRSAVENLNLQYAAIIGVVGAFALFAGRPRVEP
ncbi:hypothetical protein BKA62DRAFT_378510 [Auriculariales sp. MPI-PUGE-AT-0066]|nr:hypothetical protein BKA62DRAFT_378510 [Auriculariales sp. MPI-PUGE-AT-0066]